MQAKGPIMALDIGERRIGVAMADPIARIAHPLTTLQNDDNLVNRLQEMIENQRVAIVVVGLPRGLDGQETAQTKAVREMTKRLEDELHITCAFQDEAVTSVLAEEELKATKKTYSKEDIDMYAAARILEDYLSITMSGAHNG